MATQTLTPTNASDQLAKAGALTALLAAQFETKSRAESPWLAGTADRVVALLRDVDVGTSEASHADELVHLARSQAEVLASTLANDAVGVSDAVSMSLALRVLADDIGAAQTALQ